MRKQIYHPEVHIVVSAEDTLQDYFHGNEFAVGTGDRYLGVAGSDGDSGKHPADMADAQRSAGAETAPALLQRSDDGTYPTG